MNHTDKSRILTELRKSRKYRHVCFDTLERITAWALARHGSHKEALKAAKRKLHQVYAAYLGHAAAQRFENLIEAFPETPGEDALKQACLPILQCHASTAERIPLLTELFSNLFHETGTPRSILDLACGLNPFAMPWMALPPETEYLACDIDQRITRAINTFLHQLKQPGAAFCQDILLELPRHAADVVFIFKTLPCLEQQNKGASANLLTQLLRTNPCIVVSFPALSLGGRRTGMAEHYTAFLQSLLEPQISKLHISLTRLDYPNEIFFLLKS